MEKENSLKRWKSLAIISTCLLLIVSTLYALGVGWKKNEEPAVEPEAEVIENETTEAIELSNWTDDAQAKVFLEEYMKDITDPNSKNFIPVENRIAVFDLDGTLFCETDPVYFDHMLFMHRVLEDPNHKATEFELEVAEKVQEFIDTGSYPEGLDYLHGRGVASAFAGMTLKEFADYVHDYANTPTPSYTNMNRGDAFYLPLVGVVDYLQDNDFKVYIVSGTDRLIVRGVADQLSFMHIPPEQIIGSDELLTTRSNTEGAKDGLDYKFANDDELILAGEFIIKNLQMNKVAVIAQEIGIQPVLAFGNSSGDYSMGKYTTTDNPYRSMAFMLCCDDTERENGNVEKAAKMVKTCEENGWIPISMKNDWKTIYGVDVVKK